MDGLSSAASVIAVVQLAGSIVKLCGSYIQGVRVARDDISELKQAVTSLLGVLQQLEVLLQGPHISKRFISQTLEGPITECCSSLAALEVTIDPGRGGRVMRKFGLRAWKWPLKRIEVDKIIQDIERYKSFFTLSLTIDQTALITGISGTTDRIKRNMDLKQLPVAHGAEFDSNVNQYEDHCLPGTREEPISQILKWAKSPQGKCIFWLNGRAGTGKSTISRTVAKSFKEANSLGASFFFKRGEEDRANATKLVPTIARQITKLVPQLISCIQKEIYDDYDIATKGLKEQFDKLLLRPLLQLDLSTFTIQNLVIVIDALDECEVDNDTRLILQLLPLLQNSSSLRLRILITSRPEFLIRLGFSEIASQDYEVLILHEIPERAIENDISLFLQHRLSKIRRERSLPIDWPSDSDSHKLMILSTPLFIFAATACRLFEDPHWDPVESLAEILRYRIDRSKLDGIYLPVLSRLLNGQSEKQKRQLVQEIRAVLGTIVILESPLSVMSLSRLTGLPERLIYLRLNPLHSVLSVPDNKTLPVRLFHLSFRDFILHPETGRKTPFWVDKKETHQMLTLRCLLVSQSLRKNICGLLSDGTRRTDIDPQIINYYLSPELQYSCRYWVHHLVQSKDLDSLIYDAYLFLQKHFLHWIEAMSIIGLISEVVGSINLLQSAIYGDNKREISEFLHDAKRFYLKNQQIANDTPLQLYCTGLVFAPTRAIVRTTFMKEIPGWLHTLPNLEQTWNAQLQILEGHAGAVYSVAFSPDGHLLASGSNDKTIRLWNTSTGTLHQIFVGHSDLCRSVAFSPNGRILASGSFDKTVKLWDLVMTAALRSLEGHLDYVYSVKFSPNSRVLASGSKDKTVRLWDTATGAVLHVLEGHLHLVYSVAFSSDGRLLASGSYDKTIKLWNPSTGSLERTLDGHTGWVWSVVFSTNGRLLASSSDDKTIRLWNTATGILQQNIKSQEKVESLAFSPEGQILASSSQDKTIRLWDTSTGTLQRDLEGPSTGVRSVAFSPDGRLLVSGSQNKTVTLWDIAAQDSPKSLPSHSGRIRCLAFSPDGRTLASGSDDTTVRLWDTATGTPRQTLQSHSDWVWSVVFSSEGSLLASCSKETVRLWDVAKGSLLQTIESHRGEFRSIAFSADSCRLASGSCDNMVRIWEATTAKLLRTLQGHTGWIWSVAFSANGRLLASGSADQTIRLWDTATGALEHIFEGHTGWVRSVAFSSDSRLLASGSDDKTVRLWDLATGFLQQVLRVEGKVHDLAFSAHNSNLNTNLGSLGIKPWYNNSTVNTPEMECGVFLLEQQWVTLCGKKALWLPPEYRPSCSAFKRNNLVMGHESGRVSFIGFAS